MQKEMATIELVAQDNHERARRLMKELSQMQHEYLELKKQVFTPKAQLASLGHHVGLLHPSPRLRQALYVACGSCEKFIVKNIL